MDGEISTKKGLCVINPIVQEVYWWYGSGAFLVGKAWLKPGFFDRN